MKKKVLALIMTVLLVVCMGGCKGKADKSADDVVATSGDAATMTDAAVVTDESEKAQSDEEKTDDKSDKDNKKDNTEEASSKPSGTDKPETEIANSGSVKPDSSKPDTPNPDSSKPDTSNNGAPSTTQAQQTSQPQAGAEEQTTAHQHTWKTVVDKEAYDEPVYEEQDVYEWHAVWWPDGTYADELAGACEKQRWCMLHCVSCNPECPDPDPQGRCALKVVDTLVWVGTEKVQVGTEHHDAVTHQECTVCGAWK